MTDDRLRLAVEALRDGAKSLDTIAAAAGSRDLSDGLLREMSQVRGYARSRANAMRAALVQIEAEEPKRLPLETHPFRPNLSEPDSFAPLHWYCIDCGRPASEHERG